MSTGLVHDTNGQGKLLVELYERIIDHLAGIAAFLVSDRILEQHIDDMRVCCLQSLLMKMKVYVQTASRPCQSIYQVL